MLENSANERSQRTVKRRRRGGYANRRRKMRGEQREEIHVFCGKAIEKRKIQQQQQKENVKQQDQMNSHPSRVQKGRKTKYVEINTLQQTANWESYSTDDSRVL